MDIFGALSKMNCFFSMVVRKLWESWSISETYWIPCILHQPLMLYLVEGREKYNRNYMDLIWVPYLLHFILILIFFFIFIFLNIHNTRKLDIRNKSLINEISISDQSYMGGERSVNWKVGPSTQLVLLMVAAFF